MKASLRFVFCLALMLIADSAYAAETTETQRIASLIFHNECASKESCLTSWNKGEDFASLGIGHFIWYPMGTAESDKHFRESFPSLMVYLQSQGIVLPVWMQPGMACPWSDRATFEKSKNTPKMNEIRTLLIKTMPLQANFMKKRFDHSLTKMLEAVPESDHARLEKQYQHVAAAPMGMYALMDYVNFKGEGTNPKASYQGFGWGLLQVLGDMQEAEGLKAIHAFAESADRMLTRRVQLSPPGRNEKRWLSGWRKRLGTYIKQAELQSGS